MAQKQSKTGNFIDHFIHFFSDRGLWHAVVGAFIGGVIAFGAGLMVYQIQENKQVTREVEKKKEDKKILLQGFEKNLEANLELLKLLSNPKDMYLLVNNLNLFFLQSTAQVKYQELDNMELAKEIDDVAFRLNSMEQDVKSYQAIYYNPLSTAGTRTNFLITRGEFLRRNILNDAAQEIKKTEPVLADVRKELKKMGVDPSISKP
jgi:hypothetical protein